MVKIFAAHNPNAPIQSSPILTESTLKYILNDCTSLDEITEGIQA
jgi:hypothetical protein